MEKEFWLTMNDGINIYAKKWISKNKKPKAILQLSHGMAEHINRYNLFAEFLLDHQIFVYGNDHRGHGNTGKKQGLLGYFSDKNGFSKTVDDLYTITKLIKKEYPGVPIFLMGHSMGSFLAREYIQKYSQKIDGVILAGTGYNGILTATFARTLAKMLPQKKVSHLLNTLAFSSYNLKVKKPQTEFDWLTRNKKDVARYISDPLCGYVPTAGFFHDLSDGLIHIQNDNNANINKDLSVFLVSGQDDPVGRYGKGVFKVAQNFLDLGLTDIKTMLYEGARHELLHELNKIEIYNDLYEWMNERL